MVPNENRNSFLCISLQPWRLLTFSETRLQLFSLLQDVQWKLGTDCKSSPPWLLYSGPKEKSPAQKTKLGLKYLHHSSCVTKLRPHCVPGWTSAAHTQHEGVSPLFLILQKLQTVCDTENWMQWEMFCLKCLPHQTGRFSFINSQICIPLEMLLERSHKIKELQKERVPFSERGGNTKSSCDKSDVPDVATLIWIMFATIIKCNYLSMYTYIVKVTMLMNPQGRQINLWEHTRTFIGRSA